MTKHLNEEPLCNREGEVNPDVGESSVPSKSELSFNEQKAVLDEITAKANSQRIKQEGMADRIRRKINTIVGDKPEQWRVSHAFESVFSNLGGSKNEDVKGVVIAMRNRQDEIASNVLNLDDNYEMGLVDEIAGETGINRENVLRVLINVYEAAGREGSGYHCNPKYFNKIASLYKAELGKKQKG